jgi:hypothetical protein
VNFVVTSDADCRERVRGYPANPRIRAVSDVSDPFECPRMVSLPCPPICRTRERWRFAGMFGARMDLRRKAPEIGAFLLLLGDPRRG